MFEANDKIPFRNCCRICTNQCVSGQSIFEYIVLVDKRPVEMLEYCLQQPVDTSTQFPENICTECIPILIETYKFFTLYKKSEKYFNALQRNLNETIEDRIKVEPITVSEHFGIIDDVPIKDEPGFDEINTPEVIVFVESLVPLYGENEMNEANRVDGEP